MKKQTIKMMNHNLTKLLLASLLVQGAQGQELKLEQKIELAAGAGEIVSFTGNGASAPMLAVSHNPLGGVQTFKYSGGGFILNETVDLSAYFNVETNKVTGFTFGEVSSVSLDPLGRGFGFAAIINGTTDADGNDGLGRVGVFDYNTGTVLGSFATGYHPDQVTFSSDGSYVSVANEGELGGNEATDNRGSLSLFNVSSVTRVADAVTGTTGGTYDFTDPNITANFRTNVAGVRSHFLEAGSTYENVLEPEYTAFSTDNSKVFVGFQENNAVGVFDVATSKWTNVTDLGVHQISIDPSDKDGASNTSTVVYGAPQPDSIVTFSKGGKNYLVTANEGDARGDDDDEIKVGDFTGALPNDPDGGTYDPDEANVGGVGRLGLINDLSDSNGDGTAEKLVTFGTRDIIIWEISEDGSLSKVSNVDMEEYVLGVDPTRHNANDGGDPGEFDKRSDNKGPEPESVSVHVDAEGNVYILAGNERQNGLVLIDATDPANPKSVGYINSHDDELLSPESSQLVEIDGELVAIVGYEAFDGQAGGIGVYSVQVPEPSSVALFSLGCLAFLGMRRRSH